MPPPLVESDPFQRPFMDPYGRAKTVRIGKWRWPPPDNVDSADNFIAFKLRQNQRKTTPQSQHHHSHSNNGSIDEARDGTEWESFDALEYNNVERFKSEPALNKPPQQNRVQKRSFDIGADRPTANAVGKLKLSTEMRQRLEKVTSGHSVRSTNSTKSDFVNDNPPVKLDESRKLMLEQQLGGANVLSVKTQIQRMEASKIQKPFMPLPSVSKFHFLKVFILFRMIFFRCLLHRRRSDRQTPFLPHLQCNIQRRKFRSSCREWTKTLSESSLHTTIHGSAQKSNSWILSTMQANVLDRSQGKGKTFPTQFGTEQKLKVRRQMVNY